VVRPGFFFRIRLVVHVLSGDPASRLRPARQGRCVWLVSGLGLMLSLCMLVSGRIMLVSG